MTAEALLPQFLSQPEVIHLPNDVLAEAQDQARHSYPHESCGLLIGSRRSNTITIHRMLRCANDAPLKQQRHRFAISPLDLLAADDSARAAREQLLGLVHSHCNGPARPSAADHRAARTWPQMLWLILGLSQKQQHDYSAWWPGAHGLSQVHLSRPTGHRMLWSKIS